MSLFIQKYGGTSVGTLDRIQAVSAHIASSYHKGHRIVVVVSAMGQQTDELFGMALALSSRPPQREVDMLLSTGERISMSLLAIALNELNVPTLSFTGSQSGILTDNTFGNARIQRILGNRIREALERNRIAIVAGFQGMSEHEKEITTLGRGGSDLTAIALAYALKAESCQIFKDVDGVCTADPRLVPSAATLPFMSWDSLSLLTSFGSGVVHHRGVHLAKKFQIPLEIRSSFNLNTPGTLVGSHRKLEKAVVYALTHRQDLSWLSLDPFPAASLPALLNFLWSRGEHPIFIQQQRSKLELVCSSRSLSDLAQFIKEEPFHVILTILSDNAGSITVVGDGFWLEPGILKRAIQSLGTEPLLIDCKNSTISFLLPQGQVTVAAQTLHRELLETSS